MYMQLKSLPWLHWCRSAFTYDFSQCFNICLILSILIVGYVCIYLFQWYHHC